MTGLFTFSPFFGRKRISTLRERNFPGGKMLPHFFGCAAPGHEKKVVEGEIVLCSFLDIFLNVPFL